MATALSVEDIAELRKQGDLRTYLQMHLAANRTPVAPAPAAVVPAPDRDPGRRPGAWPTGTQAPAPTRTGTPEEWAHATRAYSQWLAAGQPAGDFTCECGCTPRRHR